MGMHRKTGLVGVDGDTGREHHGFAEESFYAQPHCSNQTIGGRQGHSKATSPPLHDTLSSSDVVSKRIIPAATEAAPLAHCK